MEPFNRSAPFKPFNRFAPFKLFKPLTMNGSNFRSS